MTILFVTINKIISLYIRDIIDFMDPDPAVVKPAVVKPAPPQPPAKLIRQKSDTITQQKEGSCTLHACSTTITRLLKVYFSDHFGAEIEWCDYYYQAKLCDDGNIFHCFKDDKDNNACTSKTERERATIPKRNLDKDGWNAENISALLYNFIYSTLYPDYVTLLGKNSDLMIVYFFESLKTKTIDNAYVSKILKYQDSTLSFTDADKKYFNSIIDKLIIMLNDVKQKLIGNKDPFPLVVHTAYYNANSISRLTEIYNSFTGKLSDSINNSNKTRAKSILRLLNPQQVQTILSNIKYFIKHILNDGLYVMVSTPRHIVVLNDFKTKEDGKEYVIVKNSWGRFGNSAELYFDPIENKEHEILLNDMFMNSVVNGFEEIQWYFLSRKELYDNYEDNYKKVKDIKKIPATLEEMQAAKLAAIAEKDRVKTIDKGMRARKKADKAKDREKAAEERQKKAIADKEAAEAKKEAAENAKKEAKEAKREAEDFKAEKKAAEERKRAAEKEKKAAEERLRAAEKRKKAAEEKTAKKKLTDVKPHVLDLADKKEAVKNTQDVINQLNMVSSMIVNLLKVSFSNLFEDENDDNLCYTFVSDNGNVFEYIKKGVKQNCMLSVLLFYFIYTIIKENTKLHYNKISFFFNFLKTQEIDESLVQSKLNYKPEGVKEEDKQFILEKMVQLKTLLREVKASLFDGSFFPHLYYCKFNKEKVVGPDLIYKYPKIVYKSPDIFNQYTYLEPNYERIKKQFSYGIVRIKRPKRPPRPTHPKGLSEEDRPPRPKRPDRPPRPGKEILQDFLTRTLNKKLNVILITADGQIKTITELKETNLTIKTQENKENNLTFDSLFNENTYEVLFFNTYDKDDEQINADADIAGIAGIAGGNGNNYKHKTKKLKIKNKKRQITSKKYKGYKGYKRHQTKSKRSKKHQTKSKRSKKRKKLLNITHKII
jgi:hypothetical protein